MVLLAAVIASALQQPLMHSAVARALPPLMMAATVHIEKKTCFGCHNQGYPVLAFRRAADRGFAWDAFALDPVLDHARDFLASHSDEFESGKSIGGGADTVGWALLTLHEGRRKPDATTEAAVKYILNLHPDRDHWRPTSNRPPTQGSRFGTTYLAVRALQNYATKGQREAADKRIAAAKAWLETTAAMDHQDRVFRLLGLKATAADTTKAAKELLETQRPDGGWSQLETLDSDDYATGSALVALHEAGGIATDSSAYRKGVALLLSTQKADGTWHVATRSKPIQPYYEGGFPYGKDQFIACPASAWATAALVLGLPKK